MVKYVEIRSMEKITELFFDQQRNNNTGRMRSSYFFRGIPDTNFKLTTSLQRNCGELAYTLEAPILENFIKYDSIDDPSISESIWKAMIVGQHHGLPTRLMDWTHSPLIALHFANTEMSLSDLDKRDCAVWRIDARELNSKLPGKYQKKLQDKKTFIFSVATLSELATSLEEYDRDMDGRSFITLEPPSIDQRIVNQYAFFTVSAKGISTLDSYLEDNTENTVKYIIDKNLRWDLRDILDQYNMNERMIYPGVDGLTKWLARHYFVKG